jgi:hypothetical protein
VEDRDISHTFAAKDLILELHGVGMPPIALAFEDIKSGKIGSLASMYYRLNHTFFVPAEMFP